MQRLLPSVRHIAILIFAISLLSCRVFSQTESILYNFTAATDCFFPEAPVVADKNNNLFGVCGSSIFELTSSGDFSILYSSGDSGGSPANGVVLDQQGNIYGMTSQGGAYQGGIIFQISTEGVETVLHSFNCETDGCFPFQGPSIDQSGNLYGAATIGGSGGYGTVFKFNPTTSNFTTLYNFTGNSDGGNPYSAVVDSNGNVYGPTQEGVNYGLIFKVTPSGTETVLHVFLENGKDGFAPSRTVALDGEGNVYGSTIFGGKTGIGTIFKITPAGKETILHSFKGGADGWFPQYGPVLDSSGNLYGTTLYGGTYDGGTVYKVAKTKETVLHSFAPNGTDGLNPYANVTLDANGNLVGTTSGGGDAPGCEPLGCGTIFGISFADGAAVAPQPPR